MKVNKTDSQRIFERARKSLWFWGLQWQQFSKEHRRLGSATNFTRPCTTRHTSTCTYTDVSCWDGLSDQIWFECILFISLNRTFADRGHMVHCTRYAKECTGLQNKTQVTRKVWFFFVYISQWSFVTFSCSPVCWILYHVTSCWKSPTVDLSVLLHNSKFILLQQKSLLHSFRARNISQKRRTTNCFLFWQVFCETCSQLLIFARFFAFLNKMSGNFVFVKSALH